MSAALVAQVKEELIRRGVIPNPQQDNGDAAEITWRVAYALRDAGGKLIRKNASQNGWTAEKGPYTGQRFSHDSIAVVGGWVDLLASAGPPANENRPVWQFTPGPPPASAVADPYDLDALEEPFPEPNPPDDSDDDDDGAGGVPLPDLIAIIHSAIAAGVAGATSQMAADIAEIKRVQKQGVTGKFLGYSVTLKPPASNGQA